MSSGYRYDGSFEGFLSALAHCMEHQELLSAEFAGQSKESLFTLFVDKIYDVETLLEVALDLRKSFVDAVSQNAFATMRYAFHSEAAGVERLLADYLQLGFKVGRKLEQILAEDPVASVKKLARKVSHEAHKFKGFVRFREVIWPAEKASAEKKIITDRGLMITIMYAVIEPEADIAALIAPHFAERLNDRPWMIHDLRRSKLILFDTERWRLVKDVALEYQPGYSANEELFSNLWRSYFNKMDISARHNPRLQRQHVPLRYRKNLIEFD